MDTRIAILALGATLTIPSLALAGPIYSIDFEQSVNSGDAEWGSTIRREIGGPYTTVLGRFGTTSLGFTLIANEENTAGLGSGTSTNDKYNITRREYTRLRERVPFPDSSSGGAVSGNDPTLPTSSTFNGHKLDLGNGIKNGNTNNDDPNPDNLFIRGTYSITFDLMLFDSWDGQFNNNGPDKFTVKANGQTLFDEYLEVHTLENNFRMPDEIPELNAYSSTWRDLIYRDITLYFDVNSDRRRFNFEFIGSLSQGISDESWGIDNVRVEAVGQLRGASAPLVPAPASLTLLGAGLGLISRRKR